MSSHQLIRKDTETRYPKLAQLVAGYLHQDWPAFYSSPDEAMAAAVSEYPRQLRPDIERELRALLKAVEDDTRLRSIVSYGLGANIGFKKPRDARAFLERLRGMLSGRELK